MAKRKGASQKLSGVEKASIIMMSIDEDVASKIFALMSEDEIKEISQAMSSLGTVDSKIVDNLLGEFSQKMGTGGDIVGDAMSTQKLLSKVLGEEKVNEIMENIGGISGYNTWEKMNNVSEEMLASYLKNEYPQTVALILSKLRTSRAASVISILPDELALDVMQRMMAIVPVKKEVLMEVEKTLQQEFMSNIAATKQHDSYEAIAEIFNNFDRSTESKFFELLDEKDPDASERIRDLMFTFEDLKKVNDQGIQTLISKSDNDKLAVALKGADDEIRDLFFRNMSERAAKLMKEEMEGKGPVRMKDVDQAQTEITSTAKELADNEEIVIPTGEEEEEEMVY